MREREKDNRVTLDNYMEKLFELKIENINDLKKHEEFFKESADRCRSTEGFKENVDKYNDFKKVLLRMAQNRNFHPAFMAYIHLLEKLILSPTSFHTLCIPILLVPYIDDFLQEEKNDEK